MNNIIPKTYQIKTDRLSLRIPTIEDIPYVFSATRYKGFNDGMPWEPPKNEDELREPLKNNIKAWESGKGYSFTITEKNNNILVGRISIRQTKEKNIWNVGFWTHPASQKKGIMTEALKAILAFGFDKLSATRIEACHALWNKASKTVLEKNGMRFIRYIPKGFKKDGEWVDENLLAIDKIEWKNLRE